ncbi:MAG TPA: FecR domain-containing protein, partial [Puia sp.]|nr:FecR domain-containing protein [Puia sp.]
MDTRPTYDDIPWQLIIQALQHEETPEESVLFGDWLAASPANQAIYQRLKQMWEEGLADYLIVRDADPEQAWVALQQLLDEPASEGEKTVILHPLAGKQPLRMMRWLVAATLILVSGGIAMWYYQDKTVPIQYATIAGEQKTIPLPDGSTMVLQPETRLQLPRTYNKTDRTVILQSGTVRFDVAHQEQLPFTVDLGVASVKDIGTTFTIVRNADSITVTVTSGKIAFTEKSTGATRELSAGGALCLYTTTQHAGEVRVITPGGNSLRFDNATLQEVVGALQRQFGKKILLEDTALAQKRVTLHLDG